MKIINPSYEILTICCGDKELELIEVAGRTCYKSEQFITSESSKSFVRNAIQRGHESILEHSLMTVRFICDRGVSHEIVRHRLASFSQESTRFCNYSKDRFDNEITFVIPTMMITNKAMYIAWLSAMQNAEDSYMEIIRCGGTAEEARCVLPNSVKTEIVMSANFREWRHFFQVRAARYAGKAHPQMEELARPLLCEAKTLVPIVFDDIIIPGE